MRKASDIWFELMRWAQENGIEQIKSEFESLDGDVCAHGLISVAHREGVLDAIAKCEIRSDLKKAIAARKVDLPVEWRGLHVEYCNDKLGWTFADFYEALKDYEESNEQTMGQEEGQDEGTEENAETLQQV